MSVLAKSIACLKKCSILCVVTVAMVIMPFPLYSNAISYENLWKVLVSEDFADIFLCSDFVAFFPQDMCICCTKHGQPLAV